MTGRDLSDIQGPKDNKDVTETNSNSAPYKPMNVTNGASPRRIKCTIESGVWRVLAGALFKDKRARMRELLSNCFDAIHKREEESKKRGEPSAPKLIKIKYMRGGDLVIEDWGSGILDLYRFTRISVPSYINVNRSAKDIGYFGVGKTSFVLMSAKERVEFVSVSYDSGMMLDLGPDENDELTYSEPIYRDRALLMDHQGVRTTIKDVNKKERMAPQELADYIGEQFMPLINFEGFKIIILDESDNEFIATPPKGFEAPDKDPLFTLDDDTPVYGRLKKGKGDKNRIYRKGVLITDPLHLGYKMDEHSYLLVDSPRPPIEIMTAGRDSLQTDTDHYLDILAKGAQYCEEKGFTKIEMDYSVSKTGESSFHRTMTQQLLNYQKRHPNDTPPPFLKKIQEQQQKIEDEKVGKKLSSKRKKPTKKGGTKKASVKTGRKNKPHKHWIKDDNLPGKNKGETGLFITFRPVTHGEDGPGSVKYDPVDQLFNINVSRPSGKKVMHEQHNQKGFSQATRHFMSMGMVDCIPANENIKPEEFQRKYYDTVDEDLGDR